jgi:hypothetical protein
MRNPNRKARVLLPGLTAAAFAAWIGAPTAQGDFNIKVVQGQTAGGLTAFELEAEDTGTNGTGTALVGWDITATMENPAQGFVVQTDVDIDGDGNGSGLNNDANLTGQSNDDPYDYTGTAPSFGSTTGTFEGLPNTARTKSKTVYSDDVSVYINGNMVTKASQPVWHSFNAATDTHSPIDPAFTTPNALHSLEMEFVDLSGGDLDTSFIPFANFVVPTGAVFSISGLLGGNSGFPYTIPTTLVNQHAIIESYLSLTLTNTAPGNSNLIANVTMTGSSGDYLPQSFPVSGPAASGGYLAISGFNPATDVEIFGLDAAGETSLSQLIADIQAEVNASATVEAPTGSAGAILTANGDNIEVVFPHSTDTAYFTYDFSNYTSNGTVTISNITVIPEPTTLSLLSLTALGLLRRRRRKPPP